MPLLQRLIRHPFRPAAGIVLPSEPGSYGDQGMVLGLMALLQRQGYEQVRLLQPDATTNEFRPLIQPHSQIAFDEFFLDDHANCVRELGLQHLFFVGADVVDGSYGAPMALKRIELAKRNLDMGGRSIFLSFSYSGQGPAAVEGAFSNLSGAEFFARDSVSCERFARQTGQSGAVVTHDLAFLCPKAKSDEIGDILSAILEARRKKQTIIGMNFSTFAIDRLRKGLAETDREVLIAQVCDVVAHSIPNCFLVLISSDIRSWETHPSDQALAQLAAGYLDERHPGVPKVICSDAIQYPALITLAEELDFIIGGRMHLAIAALRGGTPAAVVKYNDKLTGFYWDFFGLGDELAPSSMDELKISIAYLKDNHTRLREILHEQLPRLLKERSLEAALFYPKRT